MGNSRQNTRFRWKDAKQLEALVGSFEYDTDNNLVFTDPIKLEENLESEGTINAVNIPEAPTTAGTYKLTVVVDSEGAATYSWSA